MQKQINQAISFARYDGAAYKRISDVPVFFDGISKIELTNSPMKVGRIAFDMFNMLNKGLPKTSGFGNEFQQQVCTRLLELPKYKELHSMTVGDEVSSAMAASVLLGDIIESIPEDLKEDITDADEATGDYENAEGFYDALQDDESATQDEIDDAAKDSIEKESAMKKANQKLANNVRDSGKMIQQGIDSAVDVASDQTRTVKAVSEMFGTESSKVGSGNLAEKMEMAKRLAGRGNEFQKFVDLLGRMVRESNKAEMSKTTHNAGAIVDITLGDDLSSAMDMDVLEFIDPDLHLQSLTRIADGSLMEYECEAEVPESKGDIIVLLDESGSMRGQREAEAKAFTLAAVQTAMRQGRTVRVMLFQTKITGEYTFEPKGSQNTNNAAQLSKLNELGRRSTGGGTDFTQPLTHLIDTVTKSEKDNADVIVVTDGHANVSQTVVDMVNELRVARGMHFYSMCIGSSHTCSLEKFSDKVWRLGNLSDASSELFTCIV